MSLIIFQFRTLLIVNDLIEKKQKSSKFIHPFVFKKAYCNAKKFTFEELKKIYQAIFQLDLDIKNGKIKPEIALDLLIIDL